jgi:RecA-family ATPase
MDRGSPEEFFSQHGTSERFVPPSDDGWDQRDAPESNRAGRRDKAKGQSDTPPKSPIEPKLVYPSSLRGLPIPEMEWIVDGWIPVGDVTLLYGDGGVGKTLLAQELMASSAIGAPWCTLPVKRCKSLGLFCEDDDNELHRRQNDIQRFLDTDFHDNRMDNMAWWSRKGEDNLLCTFDYEGVILPTALYYAILKAASDIGARLVILDTAADLFGGNENDRGQVRQFIGALSRLAMAIKGAVVLNAHPSRSGMASGGSMDSGSTGWSNSARSRLSLERLKADGDEPVDTDVRILTKRKANRSSIGEFIKLRWHEGVIASTRTGATGFSGAPQQADAEAVFLTLLTRTEAEGRPVSASSAAPNYAPKLFGKHPDRQGFGKREFDVAMQRLFAAEKIKVVEYGRSNGRNAPRKIVAIEGGADG